MASTERKSLSKKQQAAARRRRWCSLVRAYLAGLGGESHNAQCHAAARVLGVSYKTVSNYAGGPDGRAPVRVPQLDELAEVCRIAGWNPAFVLWGAPHPERSGQATHAATLEAALAAHVVEAVRWAAEASGDAPAPGRLRAHAGRWEADGAAILRAAIERETAAFIAGAKQQRASTAIWRVLVRASEAVQGAPEPTDDAASPDALFRRLRNNMDASAVAEAERHLLGLAAPSEPPAVRFLPVTLTPPRPAPPARRP